MVFTPDSPNLRRYRFDSGRQSSFTFKWLSAPPLQNEHWGAARKVTVGETTIYRCGESGKRCTFRAYESASSSLAVGTEYFESISFRLRNKSNKCWRVSRQNFKSILILKRESLFGVAIRCGQGLTDGYGNQLGQVKNEASPHAYSLFFIKCSNKTGMYQSGQMRWTVNPLPKGFARFKSCHTH